jgi:hypothetical protein
VFAVKALVKLAKFGEAEVSSGLDTNLNFQKSINNNFNNWEGVLLPTLEILVVQGTTYLLLELTGKPLRKKIPIWLSLLSIRRVLLV